MASSEHYFYVSLCADDSFYAGWLSTDTLRREREHNKGIGSKYTKARRPVQMIYKEVFGSRTEATKAGGDSKKLSRRRRKRIF